MLGKLALVFGVSYIVIMGMASIANSAELNETHTECMELTINGYESKAK